MKRHYIILFAVILVNISTILIVKETQTTPLTITQYCSQDNISEYDKQECSIYKRKVIECGIEPRGTESYDMCIGDLRMTKHNLDNIMSD